MAIIARAGFFDTLERILRLNAGLKENNVLQFQHPRGRKGHNQSGFQE
jgi:hypothetical protein|tara:strand:- start:1323 stop:1466 length:144 start_codon:yes stop_codon:yes gene_type:complete